MADPREYLTKTEWVVFDYFVQHPKGQGLERRADRDYWLVAERLVQKGVLAREGDAYAKTRFGEDLWNWEPGYPTPTLP